MDYSSEEEFDNYINDRLNGYKHRLLIIPVPRKVLREFKSPLDRYTDDEFRGKYRFRKGIVLSILLPLVHNELQKVTARGRPVPPIYQLLVVLRFYATGSIQTVTKELKYLSQASVSRIVKRVSHLLSLRIKQYIKFPTDTEQTKENFHSIGHFPNVLGVIGACHIAILNPGEHYAKSYMNNKKYFSINTQIVCGPNLEIFDIVTNPGSASDNRIFESTLKNKLEQDEIDGILIGDRQYACQRYLLTPLAQPMTKPELDYNMALMVTQNTVLKTVKIWKQLFPCLSKKLAINLSTTSHVIIATAVLYNIFQYHERDVSDVIDNIQSYGSNVSGNSEPSTEEGSLLREMYITEHFS